MISMVKAIILELRSSKLSGGKRGSEIGCGFFVVVIGRLELLWIYTSVR